MFDIHVTGDKVLIQLHVDRGQDGSQGVFAEIKKTFSTIYASNRSQNITSVRKKGLYCG